MAEDMTGRRRRLGQALEPLLIAFVYLDPRLMAAYQATISEVAADEGNRQRAAAQDAGGPNTYRRHAAAGIVA
jgi:hypothetical protein